MLKKILRYRQLQAELEMAEQDKLALKYAWERREYKETCKAIQKELAYLEKQIKPFLHGDLQQPRRFRELSPYSGDTDEIALPKFAR